MRKVFRRMQLFALILMAGSSFCFTSCSDDDAITDPNEISTSVMFGDYNGKMTTHNVPTLTAAKDRIMMNLDPKPLQLTVTMPAENEGKKAQSLVVEVQVVAGEKESCYEVENGNLKFYIDATKVMLGVGEDRQEFTGFVPTSFHFDMNQNRVSHY